MSRFVLALILDALAVLVFVVIGLQQHGSPLTLTSVLWVAWPFWVGMLLGHLLIRSWRRPFGLWPQAVFVWAICIAGAMVLRMLIGEGTATAFVVVSAVVTAVLMGGWRVLATVMEKRNAAQSPAREMADSRPSPKSRQSAAKN